MELKKIVISFKDSSLKEFHIHNEIDLEIKATHQLWFEVDLRAKPSSDLQVFNQVLLTRCYEESVLKFKELYPQIVSPLLFDLGAYTGITAIYFKSVLPKAVIYSIEPDPDNYDLLKNNTTNNHLNKVYHLQAAV